MKYTGVKATTEETEELRKLASAAENTPVISLTGQAEDCWATQAWERAQKRAHELALLHGLPEVAGYYGVTKDGEFVEV